MIDKQVKKDLLQSNFDYYIYHNEHLPNYRLLNTLYKAGFTKYETKITIEYIKKNTLKALKGGV